MALVLVRVFALILNNMNMMVCDRNGICAGITLEFVPKTIDMSIIFGITGTMSGTVRRSISM